MRITDVQKVESPKKSFSLGEVITYSQITRNNEDPPVKKASRGVPLTLKMMRDFIESSK